MSARDFSEAATTCGLLTTLSVEAAMATSAACDCTWLVMAVVSGKPFSWATVWAMSAEDNWSTGLASAVGVSVEASGAPKLLVLGFCNTKVRISPRTTTFDMSRPVRKVRRRAVLALSLRTQCRQNRPDRTEAGMDKRSVNGVEDGVLINNLC